MIPDTSSSEASLVHHLGRGQYPCSRPSRGSTFTSTTDLGVHGDTSILTYFDHFEPYPTYEPVNHHDLSRIPRIPSASAKSEVWASSSKHWNAGSVGRIFLPCQGPWRFLDTVVTIGSSVHTPNIFAENHEKPSVRHCTLAIACVSGYDWIILCREVLPLCHPDRLRK